MQANDPSLAQWGREGCRRKAHAMLCVSWESSPEGLCICHRLSTPQPPPTLPDMEPVFAILVSVFNRQTFRLHTSSQNCPLQSSRSQGDIQTAVHSGLLPRVPAASCPLSALLYKWSPFLLPLDSSWASPWWTSLLHEGASLSEPVLGLSTRNTSWQRLPFTFLCVYLSQIVDLSSGLSSSADVSPWPCHGFPNLEDFA